MKASGYHIPVLLPALLDLMQLSPPCTLIDGTLGDGGHTIGFLQAAGRQGHVLALDRDDSALRRTRSRLQALGLLDQVTLVHAEFASLQAVAVAHGFAAADNILLDLGFSSHQVDSAGRGFSFRLPGPLDMRMDRNAPLTAADIVNHSTEGELAALLQTLGEERHAGPIARAIVQARPLATTAELAAAITRTRPGTGFPRRHPATRTFQALRMAVNDELAQLQQVLPQAIDLLATGGRLFVISFHSLEDRIVKQFLHTRSRRPARNKYAAASATPSPPTPVLTLLGKGPIRPDAAETAANPRSRSARLRAACKLGPPPGADAA